MSAKHTPGPWRVEDIDATAHNDEPITILSDKAGKCSRNGVRGQWEVAKIGDGLEWDDRHDAMVRADARLIAAAPDLLAACEAMEACSVDATDEEITRVAAQNRAAIAKARGGA